jgi:restriction system protein
VGERFVRDLYGTMRHEDADRAYLVTTGHFTAPALAWAKGKPIELWDGSDLGRLALQMGQPVPAAEPIEAAVAGSGATQWCPRCGSALVQKYNRRTGEAFLACPTFPSCRYTRSFSESAV